MPNLKHGILGVCRNNKDGSYNTQQDRLRILLLVDKHLSALGYKQLSIYSIKQKHINALTNYWTSNNIKVSSIKNRLSAIRWLLDKTGRSNTMPKANSALGIARRDYKVTPTDNRAHQLDHRLEQIPDPYTRYSLKLQQHFGLRREESIKFKVSYADRGNHLYLKGSWTKGGRPRIIPIRTDEQRALLNEISVFVGNGSLIPSDKQYIQQRSLCDYYYQKAGFRNMHGLRHYYAQQRFRELTGFEPPICGGKTNKGYTPYEHYRDQSARMVISRELGHGREDVTVQYLGR